jgi:hypothetical protein
VRKNKFALSIAVAAGIGVNAWLAWPSIHVFAPSYDEPVHLTAGYVCLKTGDYRLNGLHHPPFAEMWSALPLLFFKTPPLLPLGHPAWIAQRWTPADQYGFSDVFLYHNRVPASDMIAAGRTMQWILQCGLGVLLVAVAANMMGFASALLVLLAWAFSPIFLAHGTQIATDNAFAFFYFAFFAALAAAPKRWQGVLSGVALGLGLASKFFAVAMLPSLAACVAWDAWQRRRGRDIPAFDGRVLAVMLPVALFTIAVVYRFDGLDIFFNGLFALFTRAEAGRSSFFMGRHGVNGWLLYFPVAVLIKTPLGFLLAAIAGAALWGKRIRWPSYLWIPPLLFFAVACLSNVQIGHRYILACYPFLTLAVGGVALSSNIVLIAGVAALLWQAIAAIAVRPHYLAYFNELIGGPSNGYRYLTDSNVDWGQALSLLPEVLTPSEKENGVYLSYFGTADPHAYGLRYLDVGSTGVIRHPDDTGLNLQPTTLVISATNLQATYYEDKQVFAWLQSIRPRAVVGYSLFVYDLSAYPDKLEFLKRLRSQ